MEQQRAYAEQTPEQKAYKEAKDNLRQIIAEKEKEQRYYKQQRLTARFKGERGISPVQASSLHAINRGSLRHYYVVYALVRKQYSGYTKAPEGPVNGVDSDLVDKLVKKYAPKVVRINP